MYYKTDIFRYICVYVTHIQHIYIDIYVYVGVLSVCRCVRPVLWGTLCLARWSEELVKAAGRYVIGTYRYFIGM